MNRWARTAFPTVLLAATLAHAQSFLPISAAGKSIPTNSTTDASGNAYSFTNSSLIKTSSSGVIATLATAQAAPPPSGPNAQGNFIFTSVVVDQVGNVYAAESPTAGNLVANHGIGEVILKINPSGVVTTTNLSIASNAYDVPDCVLTVDSQGNVFTIAPDFSIVEVEPSGSTVSIAGAGEWMSFRGTQGGTGPAGVVGSIPTGLSVDAQGDLFVTGADEFVPNGPDGYTINGPMEFLVIGPAPTVIVQPLSQSIPLGSGVVLEVTAAVASSFQWYFNGVPISGATNIQQGSYLGNPLPGSVGSSLAINNAQLANAGIYTVVATNGVGSVTSSPAVLTVTDSAPTITTQPVSESIALGGIATFTVNAGGNPSPTYQWEANGTNINGATGSSLTIANAQPSNAGTYTVVVTNGAGSVTSNPVTLTIIGAAPTVTTEPISLSIILGASATFSVTAAGNPAPTYQWQFDGFPINGATNSNLTINNAQFANEGTYTVVVVNAAGSVSSSPVTLSVTVPVTYATTTFATPAGAGPKGVAVDLLGNVYVTVGNAVEKVTSTGSVFLVAGSLTVSGSADGAGSTAQFNGPKGIATDSAGNIYVADTGNNAIRKVTSLGQVTTLAGLIQGNLDGIGVAAEFNGPIAVAVDGSGNVYVADAGNNELRKVTSNGSTTTLLSGTTIAFVNNGIFGAQYSIAGVAVDNSGIPYVGVATNIPFADGDFPGSEVGVLKVSSPGSYTVVLTEGEPSTLGHPSGGDGALAIDSSGIIYALAGNTLFQGGTAISSPSGAYLEQPQPLAIFAGSKGQIYEAFSGVLYVVTPLGSAPNIASQPVGATIAFGATTTLSVLASGTPTPTYQWQVNGVNITGAISSSYVTSEPGRYTVVVTNSAGSVTSSPVVVAATTRLANVSTRAQVGTGANVEIAGFVISGPSGSTEQLLIRSVGPTLAQSGVSGVLAQPILTLYNSSGAVIATNAGWGTNSNAAQIASTAAAVGAFALPLDSADSALLVSLPPGAYTAEVTGLNNTTGVALAEAYEVTAGSPELINVSTRAFVSAGSSVEIAGIVVTGSQSAKVLVRAVGPTLSQFGVSGILAQPTLSVVNSSGATIATNTGWSTSSNPSTITSETAAVGTFNLPMGSADCALLLTLAPGSYTAVVSGVGATSGVCLVEAYQAP